MMIRTFGKIILLLLPVLLLPAIPSVAAEKPVIATFWPVFDYRSSPAVDYSSLNLFGPFVKYETKAEEYDVALRPLFYHAAATERDASLTDILYPVLQLKKDENRRSFSILRLINYESQSGDGTDFSIFPLVFYRRAESRPTTLAVFPFAGTIHDRLGRDEISYVLWPLYVTSKKGHTRARNYLWPFFATISGDDPSERGLKFWPIFGKAEYPGVYRKFFLLWPFWFDYDERLDTDNPVAKRYFFPFYLHRESPESSRRTVLWPFFSYLDDRGKGYTEWNYPWPLWQRAVGDYKHGWKFLPFASDMTRNDIRSRWFLWPLVKFENQKYETITRHRLRVLFFLYRDLSETYIETGEKRYQRNLLWPLFGYERKKGVSHFYALALLKPFLPESDGIERNWSPLWRIFQRKWDVKGNRVTSVLWNLYWSEFREGSSAGELFPLFDWRREEGVRKWNFLKGLVGYERDREGRHLKLFYLPWTIPLGESESDERMGAG